MFHVKQSHTSMRLALASCSDLPDWEVDDAPLHRILRSGGHEVHTPAWNADVSWEDFDGVLIRTTWDYTAHREAFLAWCRRLGGRVFNPPEVVAWNTHKAYLRDLERRGVPIVPTVWLAAGQQVEAPGHWPFDPAAPVFLKPCVGATAEGTARFEQGWGAQARAWAQQLTAQGDAMLQPYLARVGAEGERSAIVVDGEVTHWVCKVPVPGDYRVQDDFGASDHVHTPSSAEQELVRRTLDALPEGLLYARVDWLLDDHGPRINEVEMVEPSLFFRHGPHAATALATAWLSRLHASRP